MRGTMLRGIAIGVIAYEQAGPRVYETEGRRAAESTMPTYHFIKLDPKIEAQCLKLILGCIFEKERVKGKDGEKGGRRGGGEKDRLFERDTQHTVRWQFRKALSDGKVVHLAWPIQRSGPLIMLGRSANSRAAVSKTNRAVVCWKQVVKTYCMTDQASRKGHLYPRRQWACLLSALFLRVGRDVAGE